MRKINLFFLFLFAVISFQGIEYNSDKDPKVDYDLKLPAVILILPDSLHEISGLTTIDSSTIACIQDENGILFIYDIVHNRIKKQSIFNIDGDYEGITRVDQTIYILRSDGILYEIQNYNFAHFKLSTYNTGIPATNNEGLCYDKMYNRLLIGCKSRIKQDGFYKDDRLIYAFDLQSKKLSKDPVYVINVKTLKDFATKHNIKLPTRKNKKGKQIEQVLKFKTSAIGIHPITHKLYLLSAYDHMLFVFDRKGNIEAIHLLDPVVFNKAEGICFFENGDMLISNEGQTDKPTILRFNYESTK